MPSQNNNNLNNEFNTFQGIVEQSLDSKQKGLFKTWLKVWGYYIRGEKGFKPHLNRKYNAGDIITVAYGYNVGSEQGGNRPSVVIEDNDLSDKTIMVVPLGSLDEDESEETIHEKNVYLGELADFNKEANKPEGTESKALVHQMRCVSKQRIIRPKKEEEKVITLNSDKLKNIYKKISELYTSEVVDETIKNNENTVKASK